MSGHASTFERSRARAAPVGEPKYSMRRRGRDFGMRDENSGRVVALELRAQQCEHFGRGIRIEIAGRFVRQHEARPMCQRPRDRHSLHFTAGQLRSADRSPIEHADRSQHLATRARSPVRRAVERQRQPDVALDGQVRQQMKRLKDESHARPPQPRAAGIVERGHVLTGDDDAARVRHVEPGDEIEQRGFAGARLAHDGDVLARGELQRHVSSTTRVVRLRRIC